MANAFWVGGAPVTRQVSTITIANTWAAADVVIMTVGGSKDLRVTIGSAFGVSDVAAALAAAINAADATTGLIGNETRNVGGQEILEFFGLEAVAALGVVTITGLVSGQPFTLTASEVTAGTGTATAASVTAATGPNHADNADNWLAGTLPASNDDLYFDRGDVSCLYGLDHFRTATKSIDLIITNDWTGQMGLDPISPGGYAEYRTRFFQTYGNSLINLDAGVKSLTQGGRLYIDCQTTSPTINLNVARSSDLSRPSVFIAGGDPILTAKAGNVVLEPDDAQTSDVMEISAVYAGVPGGNNADLVLTGGRRLTWDAGGATLYTFSGTITWNNAFTVTGTAVLKGGVTRLVGTNDAAVFPAFNVEDGATLMPIYGAECGTIEVFSGGTLDCRETRLFFTTSNGATAYPGSTVRDPSGVFLFCAATSLLTLPGGTLNQITHELPANRIVDMTASA